MGSTPGIKSVLSMKNIILICCVCRHTRTISNKFKVFLCSSCRTAKAEANKRCPELQIPPFTNRLCRECKTEATKHVICKNCFFRLYIEATIPYKPISSMPDVERLDELSMGFQVLDANKDFYDFIQKKINVVVQNKTTHPYPPCQVSCPLNLAPHLPPSGDIDVLYKRYGLCNPALHFAFKVPGFKHLFQEDQRFLLRSGLFKMLFLKVVSLFDSNAGVLRCLNGQIIRKDEVQGSYEENSLNSMFAAVDHIKACNLSENEMGLLSAVMLMNPHVPGLKDKDSVAIIRRKLENVLCVIKKPAEEIERIKKVIPSLNHVYLNHQISYSNSQDILEYLNKENIQPNILEDCRAPAACSSSSSSANNSQSPAASSSSSFVLREVLPNNHK